MMIYVGFVELSSTTMRFKLPFKVKTGPRKSVPACVSDQSGCIRPSKGSFLFSVSFGGEHERT